MKIHRLCFTIACMVCIGVFLHACGPRSAPQEAPGGPLAFYDSTTFDNKLSSALAANPPEVIIEFPAPVTLNAIPTRLDHWLSKVEEYDGEVELVPVGPADKGIFSEAMSFVVSVYEYLKEKALYFPVKEYDVEIHYARDSGNVEKVVFQRKETAS